MKAKRTRLTTETRLTRPGGPTPLFSVSEHAARLLAGEREQPPSARHFHQDSAGETSDNDVVADAHCRNRGKAYYGLGGRIRA